MFRRDRFELLSSGQAWLSETPEKVGSKGWDAAFPRIVTWAKLKDRSTGGSLVFFNTHWDHKGVRARVESGKLMRRLVDEHRDGLPVVVTGDFNSPETSEQYRALTGTGGGAAVALADTYRQVHPEPSPDEATFHGFKGTRTGKRIDWVLHSPEWVTKAAAIDRTQKDGRYPSDHYAVTADLAPRREPPPAGR
jgi:endonuclease/exonuclease/phosphatase family metal-dependent hydrolase